MLTPSEKQGWSCPRGAFSPTHTNQGPAGGASRTPIWVATLRKLFGGAVPAHSVADLQSATRSSGRSPTSRATRVEPQLFRLWFVPFPSSSRTCRWGRRLDTSGHCAACSRAGVLGRKGFLLEFAPPQVCREVGGRVGTNTFIRKMDVGEFNGLNGSPVEVIADCLPFLHGA